MNKKKVFLSVPMNGRTDDQILAYLGSLAAIAVAYFGKDVELFDGYTNATPDESCKNDGIYYLGESFMKLAKCDAILAPDTYYSTRGCLMEVNAADKYGIAVYKYDGKIVDLKPF